MNSLRRATSDRYRQVPRRLPRAMFTVNRLLERLKPSTSDNTRPSSVAHIHNLRVDVVPTTVANDKFPANHRLPSSRDPSCTADAGEPFRWVLGSQTVGPDSQYDLS